MQVCSAVPKQVRGVDTPPQKLKEDSSFLSPPSDSWSTGQWLVTAKETLVLGTFNLEGMTQRCRIT